MTKDTKAQDLLKLGQLVYSNRCTSPVLPRGKAAGQSGVMKNAEEVRSTRRWLLRRGSRPGRRDVQGAELGGELCGVQESARVSPEQGGQFQVPVLGPQGEHAQHLAQVALGVVTEQAI